MDEDFDLDALIFGTKVCSECGTEKARNSEQFHVDRLQPDGLKHRCKACCSEAGKVAYAADPEKFGRKNREYRARRAAR